MTKMFTKMSSDCEKTIIDGLLLVAVAFVSRVNKEMLCHDLEQQVTLFLPRNDCTRKENDFQYLKKYN